MTGINLLETARSRFPVSVFAYCVMPNHFHLVLRPDGEYDLSRFMHWLTTTHAQRLHAWNGTSGTGAVYQGRFKSVPVQCDQHFLTVCRYVERNPLRAKLVTAAEQWRWSSLWRRLARPASDLLSPWPVERPENWRQWVNDAQTAAELDSVREAVSRGAPFGDPSWRFDVAANLHLESSLRTRGRPLKPCQQEKTPDPFYR